MSGSFANEDVMEEYLAALLTEDAPATEKPVKEVITKDPDGAEVQVQKQSVARLLEDVHPVINKVNETIVSPIPVVEAPAPVPDPVKAPAPVVEPVPEIRPQAGEGGDDNLITDASRVIEGRFQSLFFNVAGLTLAVPLTELGGIHNLEKPGPLFGKPNWFMGVMLHREEKLNVVDTAKWVMPEKCNEILEDSLKYQYLIMLGDSGWGLACEELVNTVTLQSEDVKWRDMDGKRPWLAGMVKEKMCAMLDVKQLIDMLNKGLGSNDSN